MYNKNKKQQSKRKGVAITLAILFGIFAWCYTWREDKKKFWAMLGTIFLTAILAPSIASIGGCLIVAFVIVDVCLKKKEWYTNYADGE